MLIRTKQSFFGYFSFFAESATAIREIYETAFSENDQQQFLFFLMWKTANAIGAFDPKSQSGQIRKNLQRGGSDSSQYIMDGVVSMNEFAVHNTMFSYRGLRPTLLNKVVWQRLQYNLVMWK